MAGAIDEELLLWNLHNSASIKLVKADSAPLIIGFLHQEFKQAQRVSIPLPDLITQLEGYLEHLNEREPGRYPRTAQGYITEWADEQHRYIRIVAYGNGDTPTVELTSDTERSIGWIEDMQTQHFVGTESRFLMIVDLLRNIIQKSTEDPAERLEQLEQQRADIERQIALIQQTGKVDNLYTSTQLRERFFEASTLARQLLRDFRLVEDKFRDIARSLQEAQLRPGTRKGTLVEYVLDADEELKASDQGRSFYTFWEFLISPRQNDELKHLLTQLTELPDLQPSLAENNLLPHLPAYLISAGEKIVYSNSRLAEQLRRLLDEQAAAENRRVQELIQEIKQEAYYLRDNIPDLREFFELEGPPEVQLTMERELWEPSRARVFDEEPVVVQTEDIQRIDLTGLYTQFSIDEAALQQHIETLLEYQPEILLSEVITYYPIEKGLAEVLTYCSLAARDQRHSIDASAHEEIVLSLSGGDGDETAGKKVLVLPRVCYRRSAYER